VCNLLASDWELFAWGALGGFVAFLLAAATPELIRKYYRNEKIRDQRLAIPLLVMIVITASGGLSADITGSKNLDYKQAILLGLGWSILLPSAGKIIEVLQNAQTSSGEGSSDSIQNLSEV
jgi:hypothetical protein